MYGVPSDLDLSFLHEAELIQVRLGVFEVAFCFSDAQLACDNAAWSLFDSAGLCVDSGMPLPRPAFQLHRLLGARVTGTVVVAPSYLELLFHTGDRLRATDVSEVYESFTLSTDAPQRLIVV